MGKYILDYNELWTIWIKKTKLEQKKEQILFTTSTTEFNSGNELLTYYKEKKQNKLKYVKFNRAKKYFQFQNTAKLSVCNMKWNTNKQTENKRRREKEVIVNSLISLSNTINLKQKNVILIIITISTFVCFCFFLIIFEVFDGFFFHFIRDHLLLLCFHLYTCFT